MANSLYDTRVARIKAAVALEEVDKVPISLCGNAYFARQQGVLMKDYISDYELACTTNLKGFEDLGDVDSTQNVIFSPWLLTGQWLSKTYVPGKELGDDDMWQVYEEQIVSVEDYQEIIDNGFEPWYKRYLVEKMEDNDSKLQSFHEYNPKAYERFYEAGLPCTCDFLMITPFEYLCGGRELTTFFMDLLDKPDMLDEVFARIMNFTMPMYSAMMDQIKPLGVWIGGWRTAPDMLSPDIWNRFVAPYFKKYMELCIDKGVIPIFHLDSNWDNGIDWFKKMVPPKKCIMALDSKTDIRRAKSIVGDQMCILGDVPPELTAFGSYDETYSYTKTLIDDIGHIGYIAATGCDVPCNAKFENVKAIVDAANNYLK